MKIRILPILFLRFLMLLHAPCLQAGYAEASLVLAPALNKLPDYLAVEPERMSYLCDQDAQAFEVVHHLLLESQRGRQKVFLDAHLVRWLPRFKIHDQDANPIPYFDPGLDALA